MADIVNDFFRTHYPVDWKTAWKMSAIGSFCGREYAGDKSKCSTVFPEMVCADGLSLSVQGHYGAYSHPRDDFAEEYTSVEIMGPPKADELLADYERECNSVGDQMIYPYVPVSVVAKVIEKRGGLKKAEAA